MALGPARSGRGGRPRRRLLAPRGEQGGRAPAGDRAGLRAPAGRRRRPLPGLPRRDRGLGHGGRGRRPSAPLRRSEAADRLAARRAGPVPPAARRRRHARRGHRRGRPEHGAGRDQPVPRDRAHLDARLLREGRLPDARLDRPHLRGAGRDDAAPGHRRRAGSVQRPRPAQHPPHDAEPVPALGARARRDARERAGRRVPVRPSHRSEAPEPAHRARRRPHPGPHRGEGRAPRTAGLPARRLPGGRRLQHRRAGQGDDR